MSFGVMSSSDLPILVASDSPRQIEAIRKAGLVAIEVEPSEVAISERISLALIEAVANDLLQAGARVVVVYSGFEAEELDSLTVIRLGEHLEQLTARDLRALETSVPFETLKAVVDVAIEIGREGREGKPVGTLIVVGDARNVMVRTRQLGFDPFKGYRRKERNVRDFRVREAIKEIAQLDGAFVVARDGTVEAACRLIDAPMSGLTLPKGLGTRHWAAAAITEVTKSVAVVVSQSNGTCPVVPERRRHPAHRPDAARPRHEMARRRDRAVAGVNEESQRTPQEHDPVRGCICCRVKPRIRHPKAQNRQMTSLTSRLVEPFYRMAYGAPLAGRPGSRRLMPTVAERDNGGWCWWPTGWAGSTCAGPRCAMFWERKSCRMRSRLFPGGTASGAGSPI